MASVTQGASRFYYRGDCVVYPYDEGTPSCEYIRAYFADPEAYPVVEPRMAATIMLVRDGEAGCEVFMLHRVASMAFAADAYVFPGGQLDAGDWEEGIAWEGPTPQQWAERMGVDERTARAVVVTVARELFEECGVLLASDMYGRVGVPADSQMAADRAALANHETTLARVLERRGLVLRTDLLTVLSRWITPIAEPRRYDAFFFAALLPAGCVADGDTSEASEAQWVEPERILKRFCDDQTLLLPPTIFHLQKLSKSGSARAFTELEPSISPVICESAIIDGEAVTICPKA